MHNHFSVIQGGFIAAALLVAVSASSQEAATNAATNAIKSKTQRAVDAANEDVQEAILHSRVRLALLNRLEGADGLRVFVDVTGHLATLSGEVEQRSSERVAVDAARSVDGITSVLSNITVNPKAPAQENMRARLADALLVSQVRVNVLQELGRAGMGIHISATDGVVTLSGVMPSTSKRTRAVTRVEEMPSVDRVEDRMSIRL